MLIYRCGAWKGFTTEVKAFGKHSTRSELCRPQRGVLVFRSNSIQNTMPKRKSEPSDQEQKPRQVKKPKEVHESGSGWAAVPPGLLYKKGDVPPGRKIAAFDLDGTLALTNGQARFPVSENDWKLFNKNVPAVLTQYHNDGYKVVVFSNQNSIKGALQGIQAAKLTKRGNHILDRIGVPAQILYATQKDEFRKPERGMWDFFVEHLNGGIAPDLEKSFFVGDMAGRPADVADSDKGFAKNIGLPFKLPEDIFGEVDSKVQLPTAADGINHNEELCDAFLQLVEYHKGDFFKVRAYQTIAEALATHPEKVTSVNQVSKLKGFGKASCAKIDEFLTTGKLQILNPEEMTKRAAEQEKEAAEKGQGMAFKFI